MKINILIMFFVIAISTFFISCDNPVEPNTGQHQLVQNPLFEVNGDPSISGWTSQDSEAIKFSNYTPIYRGHYSIYFAVDPKIQVASLEQEINLLQGVHVYTFSFWVKSAGEAGGEGFLNVTNINPSGPHIYIPVGKSNSNWTYFTFVDTLSSYKYKSITIGLNAFSTGEKGGRIYFTDCRLLEK